MPKFRTSLLMVGLVSLLSCLLLIFLFGRETTDDLNPGKKPKLALLNSRKPVKSIEDRVNQSSKATENSEKTRKALAEKNLDPHEKDSSLLLEKTPVELHNSLDDKDSASSTLNLERTGIRGILVDNKNKPLTGVTVTVSTDSPKYSWSETHPSTKTSSTDGSFVLTGLHPRRFYKLRVENPYGQDGQVFTAPVVHENEIADCGVLILKPYGRITGRIRGPKNEPIALGFLRIAKGHLPPNSNGPYTSVDPVATQHAQNLPSHSIVHTSQAGGSFTLDGLSAGTYNLLAFSKGYREVYYKEIEVKAGQTTSGIEIKLKALGVVRFRVIDGIGKPISGAQLVTMPFVKRYLSLELPGNSSAVQISLAKRERHSSFSNGNGLARHSGNEVIEDGSGTDSRGEYVVRDLTNHKLIVLTSANGFGDHRSVVTLSENSETTVNIRLKRSYQLKGRVIDKNLRAPISLANITIKNRLDTRAATISLTSTPEGIFESLPLPSGQLSILVTKYGFQSHQQDFDASPGESINFGDIVLAPTPIRTFKVKDSFGRPVPNAIIQLINHNKLSDPTARIGSTDRNGLLSAPVPAGRSHIRVHAAGFCPGASDNIEFGLKESGKIEIQIPEKGGRIIGRCASKSQGSNKIFLFRKGHKVPWQTTVINAEGRYSFNNVTPGNYTLSANLDSASSIPVRRELSISENKEASIDLGP
ncbi:MAG: carboxypeptidase-like regulatory domain-containing protein [Planctomycetota bacterium]|nr:carboxypeptidase-like regulatory domain-containing protein [Planctomycetota bacterium]